MKSLTKKIIKYGITGTLVAASYLTIGGVGYVMNTPPKPIPEPETKIVDNKRQKSLEQILNVSHKLLNACTYDFEINLSGGKKLQMEKTLYFVGSTVGVYKNKKDKNLLFLSCDHVTEKPEKIYVLKTNLKNGLYKGLAETENGEQKEFITTEPIVKPTMHPIGQGILKKSVMGIYKGIKKDYNGKNVGINLDELTELADTGSKPGKITIKNDDISLLRLKDEGKIKNYNVWEGPWANEYRIKPGQEIYAVGYPLNLSKQITQGIISSTGTKREDLSKNFYFTSAQLNPGNSGGGVWTVQTVMDETGTLTERLALVGLGRLKFAGDGISGIIKTSNLKNFLRKEGYSYVYKKEDGSKK